MPPSYNGGNDKFDGGNQADGLIIYNGHLPSEQFPINKSAEGANPNQNLNSLARRKK